MKLCNACNNVRLQHAVGYHNKPCTQLWSAESALSLRNSQPCTKHLLLKFDSPALDTHRTDQPHIASSLYKASPCSDTLCLYEYLSI